MFVDTASQLCEATPDPLSVAPAVAVAFPLRYTGSGETLGASVGAVLSILIGPKLALAEFPALSIAVPLAVNEPSVLKIWSAGQEAIPLPLCRCK